MEVPLWTQRSTCWFTPGFSGLCTASFGFFWFFSSMAPPGRLVLDLGGRKLGLDNCSNCCQKAGVWSWFWSVGTQQEAERRVAGEDRKDPEKRSLKTISVSTSKLDLQAQGDGAGGKKQVTEVHQSTAAKVPIISWYQINKVESNLISGCQELNWSTNGLKQNEKVPFFLRKHNLLKWGEKKTSNNSSNWLKSFWVFFLAKSLKRNTVGLSKPPVNWPSGFTKKPN